MRSSRLASRRRRCGSATGGQPWPLPKWIAEIASQSDRHQDRRAAGAGVLRARHVQLRVRGELRSGPRCFRISASQRWSAPWGRGQLGGWDAFLDQMQYFGYVLPSLTALLIARRGFDVGIAVSRRRRPASCWRSCRRAAAAASSASRSAPRSSSGFRRSANRRCGDSLIAAAAAVGLLTAMQFMLNIRSTRLRGVSVPGSERLRLPARRRQLPAARAGDPDRAGGAPVRRVPAALVHAGPAGAARVLAGQADRSRVRSAGRSSA